VLAARGDAAGDYVAFMPLRLGAHFSESRGAFVNELGMAGSFSWADYTGLICEAVHEGEAVPALAGAIKRLHWARLKLRHLRMSEHRWKLFAAEFDERTFAAEVRRDTANDGAVNNELCPCVDLPADFETYLKEKLSANTRQKIRRLLRQVESSPELRIEHSRPENFERDLDILVGFWKSKWAERKGDKTDYLASRYREIVGEGLAAGTAVMPVLWRGDRPLGALGLFVDRQKKSVLYFIGARDESCDDPPPGLLLHSHSIRWAIESGMRKYDFLRGNEAFKYSFGGVDERIRNIVIRTRSGLNLGRTLDPRSIDQVLERIAELEAEDDLKGAAVGYRQVLEVSPGHPAALMGYAAVLYGMERYDESVLFCVRLIDQERGNASALRLLGKGHLALAEYDQAEAAFKKSNALGPTVSAYFYLARALEGQGKHAEAGKAMEEVVAMTPRGKREARQQVEAREWLERGRAVNRS
jgi:hypothetical protein